MDAFANPFFYVFTGANVVLLLGLTVGLDVRDPLRDLDKAARLFRWLGWTSPVATLGWYGWWNSEGFVDIMERQGLGVQMGTCLVPGFPVLSLLTIAVLVFMHRRPEPHFRQAWRQLCCAGALTFGLCLGGMLFRLGRALWFDFGGLWAPT